MASYYEKNDEIIEKFNSGEPISFLELLYYARVGIFGSLESATLGDFDKINEQSDFIAHLRLAVQSGEFDKEFFSNEIEKNQILIKTIITIIENEIDDLYEYNQVIEIDKIHDSIKEEFDEYKTHINQECILLINHLGHYVPEFDFTNKLDRKELNELANKTDNQLDKRKSPKAPPNAARIKALKEFCPELWQKLTKSQSKEIQQKVIHLITGVNFEDSYKLSFGSRQPEVENRNVDGLEELKKKLELIGGI
jgi:hypothetical protein